MVQICLFLEVFQKITFYHCTLCADIFLAIDWFYYSFYGCKTSLLKGKYIYKICKNFPNESCRKGKKQATKFHIFKILSKCWLNFRHYFGVFLRCSVSRCSWFYSIPSQREEIRSWEMPLANAISQEKTKYLRKRKIYSNNSNCKNRK